MLGDTIKELRKKQNVSQEELALKMHVVRQTVSKWEKGLSVPDAEEVIRLAEIFQISVSELLGITEKTKVQQEHEMKAEALSQKLEKLNMELAERIERERILTQAAKVRGCILMLAFAAIILASVIKNMVGAMVAAAVCGIIALIVLYQNLGLMTSVTTQDYELKPLKITTVFNIALIAACAVLALLVQIDIIKLSENGEKLTAALIVSLIIFFTGYIAPKLPFNRHTGMRLPWTVTDEDTWNVAHQILGAVAVPIGIVYVGLVPFIENFEALTVAVVLLWIGIPGVISLVYFWRKFYG